jgi:uncharacterized RDD family membrane protein YckC
MILSNSDPDYATVLARVAAYSIDIILLFAGILITQALLRPVNPLLGQSQRTSGWRSHLWVYVSVSIPILIYFALSFSSRWQATIGMRLLGIHVAGMGGEPIGLGRALLRSLVMLIPFELNHVVMFYPRPIWGDPKPGFRFGFVVVSLLMVIYLGSMLITTHHQSIHDLAAGTIVVRK